MRPTKKIYFIYITLLLILFSMPTPFAKLNGEAGISLLPGFGPGVVWAAGKQVYYEPTIKNIITNNCGRCHSGPSRNLMDYDTLKAYADSGMLAAMVQGTMSRFAGNEQGTILDWINAGAPEKPGAKKVNFFTGIHGPGGGGGGGGGRPYSPNVPTKGITYENTIQYILAKDCLRCHSGHFRNLTTFKNVDIYVKNGLLKALVQRGGAMHRFALKDSKWIIGWINNGAPQ